MRRLLILLLLAACLMPDAGPAQAQATADQLNKLSLEALTTPAPGGNPGSYHRSSRGSSYRNSGIHRSAYRSGYRRSVGRGSGYRSSGYRSFGNRTPAYRAPGTRRSGHRGSGYRGNGYHVTRSRRVASSGYRRSIGGRHTVSQHAARYSRRYAARSRQAGYHQASGYAPGPAALRRGH